MMEMLREMFEQGYRFVQYSYYGQCEVEDFEEVEDAYLECEEDEWLTFEYEVDEEHHEVHFQVEDEE